MAPSGHKTRQLSHVSPIVKSGVLKTRAGHGSVSGAITTRNEEPFMRRWIAVTTLLVIGIAASAGLAQGTPPQVEAALADLNQRLGTNLTLNSQQMLWTWAENVYTDTSLGCPQPGQAYAEVITR